MKAIAFFPAAVAAVLTLNISVASSQQVCVNEFTACMNSCGTKPSKSMQDTCFSSCETKNDMCAERVFGKRQYTPAAVAASPAQAKDAMAQKEVPQVREEQAAPEQEPAVEEKPAPAEPKKVPPQRVPVRR